MQLKQWLSSRVVQNCILGRTSEALSLTCTDKIELFLFSGDAVVQHSAGYSILIAILIEALRVDFDFTLSVDHTIEALHTEGVARLDQLCDLSFLKDGMLRHLLLLRSLTL